MGCKGLGVALKETFNGHNQMTNWLTWFVLVTVGTCITIQMNYLNKALDIFNTSVVTPILYVIFTTAVIIASAILFKEWSRLAAEDILGNICGFVTTVSGIFLLHAFKDLDVCLKNLPTKVHREVVTNNNGDANFSGRNDDSRSVLLDHVESQASEEEINTTDHMFLPEK